MTTADDRRTLLDYADWREALTLGDPDTSIEAFLQHREAEANTSRVERALEYLNGAPYSYRLDADGESMQEYDWQEVATDVRHILESDRPYVDDGPMFGPTIRTYL